MKAYISFPISGLDIAAVREKSLQDKEFVESQGWTVVNPLTVLACAGCEGGNNFSDHEHSWSEWMKADLREMLQCDIIVMCDDWQKSPGARMEFYLAVSAGLRPYLLSRWPNGAVFLTDMTDGRARRLR